MEHGHRSWDMAPTPHAAGAGPIMASPLSACSYEDVPVPGTILLPQIGFFTGVNPDFTAFNT